MFLGLILPTRPMKWNELALPGRLFLSPFVLVKMSDCVVPNPSNFGPEPHKKSIQTNMCAIRHWEITVTLPWDCGEPSRGVPVERGWHLAGATLGGNYPKCSQKGPKCLRSTLSQPESCVTKGVYVESHWEWGWISNSPLKDNGRYDNARLCFRFALNTE